jgi:hypothetical protein
MSRIVLGTGETEINKFKMQKRKIPPSWSSDSSARDRQGIK